MHTEPLYRKFDKIHKQAESEPNAEEKKELREGKVNEIGESQCTVTEVRDQLKSMPMTVPTDMSWDQLSNINWAQYKLYGKAELRKLMKKQRK